MAKSKYGNLYSPATARTPTTEKLDENQILNHSGGYVYAVSPWDRLVRFLNIGSENPTYYQRADALTKENAKCVMECWTNDPIRTAKTISDISVAGRAPKNDPAVYALALGAINPRVEARQAAYATKPDVCRIGTHQFQWMADSEALGKGYGRGFKRATAHFYNSRDTDDLAHQMVKYRSRHGYNHKRCIERTNQGALSDDPVRKNLFLWARGKYLDGPLPAIVKAHVEAMSYEDKRDDKAAVKRIIELIREHKLPWEALPTWANANPDIWKALIPTVGLTALIRNLGNITASGALTHENVDEVVKRLTNPIALSKARIHPFNVLQALAIYKSGRGLRGKKTWTPLTRVIDALNEAFYLCFKYLEPTGKNILVGLDVSHSMTSSIGSPVKQKDRYGRIREVYPGTYDYKGDENPNPLTVREASAALMMSLMKVEKNVDVLGFCHGLKRDRLRPSMWTAGVFPIPLSGRQRLDDVVKTITDLPFGATDCALPMKWALDKGKLHYDAIIIYTDNETNSGIGHPKEVLLEYRRKSGRNTKLVVCAMTASNCTIADPNDSGMLDICGMDSNVPAMITDFIR